MTTKKQQTNFEKAAAQETGGSLVKELWDFLRQNKKWWLLPIILSLFVFGFLIFLSGTAIAPFIYTLF
jgi:hypothetical protein